MMTTDQQTSPWTLSKSTAVSETAKIARDSKREPGQPCPRSLGKPACPGCPMATNFLDQELKAS